MVVKQNAPNGAARTLIHVFPTTNRTQQRVLALLRRLASTVFAPQAGFLSAALAHSGDGERIVLQTEWNDLGDFRRALRTPTGLAYWQRTRALLARGGQMSDVHVYDNLVSFYSLGAVAAGDAPRAQDIRVAGHTT